MEIRNYEFFSPRFITLIWWIHSYTCIPTGYLWYTETSTRKRILISVIKWGCLIPRIYSIYLFSFVVHASYNHLSFLFWRPCNSFLRVWTFFLLWKERIALLDFFHILFICILSFNYSLLLSLPLSLFPPPLSLLSLSTPTSLYLSSNMLHTSLSLLTPLKSK